MQRNRNRLTNLYNIKERRYNKWYSNQSDEILERKYLKSLRRFEEAFKEAKEKASLL